MVKEFVVIFVEYIAKSHISYEHSLLENIHEWPCPNVAAIGQNKHNSSITMKYNNVINLLQPFYMILVCYPSIFATHTYM